MDIPTKKTLCLTMIVKDEAKIITDMLASVAKFIDYWVIVDTGSTDGTQQVIRDFFTAKGIPGELHERPWVNFGHNRSEAMALADGKADYLWVMDADDSLQGVPDFSNLTADSYVMKIGQEFSHWRQQLFKSGLKWEYRGVLHEYAFSPLAKGFARLLGDYHLVARTAGARSGDPQKYQKDAAVLEEEVKKDPENSRNWFYLGQSYFDFQNWAEAKRAYSRRVEMGGWQEERFYAQWRVAQCAAALNEPEDVVVAHYLKAYELAPQRAEALYTLAQYLRGKSRNALAYLYAKAASQTPYPAGDSLFVYGNVYKYAALDELAINAYWIGRYKEGLDINLHLLSKKLVPPERVAGIANNMRFCAMKAGVTCPPNELHIMRPGAIGDILMALWAAEAYKRKNPTHKIYFYCAPQYLEIPAMSKAITKAIDVTFVPHYARQLIGYPLNEGYPDKPMTRHLVESFAAELGLVKEEAWQRWDLHTKKTNLPEPYITIQTKTGWSPYKEWSQERWTELVGRICAKYPKYRIVHIGDKDCAIPGVDNAKLSISEAISAVARARLHIGGDSFPNHVRGIVGRPAVILWGSTSPIGSGYKTSANIWHNDAHGCSPCYREYPNMSRHPKPHCPHCKNWEDLSHPCMGDISVDEVMAAVDKELGGK